jgi:hypothetical protein
MKALNYFLMLFMLISSMALQSCKETEDETPCNDPTNRNCPNYNPCLDAKPTSAAFTMEEVVFARAGKGWPIGDKIVYDTDTCRRLNDIVFTCTQKADSIWWIFDDTEMRPEWQQKQSFSIKFGAPGGPMQTQPERVKITCIVKNNKPNPCIPNDNGMDTFTRYMVYMPWWQMGFMGTFRGSFTHNPDSVFDLEIRWDTTLIQNDLPYYFIRFDNLLVVPPFFTTDFNMVEGFEFSRDVNYGYCAFHLDFFATGFPAIPEKYNYKGVSHRGKVLFNPNTRQLKIDFVRGGKGQNFMSEWPPKGQTLYTFTGIKL